MNLSDATFSTRGCFVTIDGWRADVSSKLVLICAGLCNVRAEDPNDAGKADELLYSPVGDTGVMACNEPRLVELAARHWSWLNSEAKDFPDTPADVLTDPVKAAAGLQHHLAILNP